MKLIERKICPFCKNNEFKNLFSLKYSNKNLDQFIKTYYDNVQLNELLKNEVFVLSKCLYCTGIFQKNIPDNNFIEFLYDELIDADTSLKKKQAYLIQNKSKLEYDYNLINLLTKKKENIKILEFGCGWGHWAKFMKSKSISIKTCEFSKIRNDYLISNGLENFKELNEIKEKFDLIYSEEVLEHLSNPLDELYKLSHLLKPGGYMLHRFPSSVFFELKLKFRYTPKKDCAHPLEHINIFNQTCFEKIANFLNLKIINLNKMHDLDLIKKIKFLKNKLLFNFIILKK